MDGGRHPGWGTANRIVPLGDAYLELVAVVDEAEASSSVFGRWVAGNANAVGTPVGWCVRPDDLDGTARRLGLVAQEGSRARPNGEIVRWRTVGVDQASAEPPLPFFIERAPGTPFPGELPLGTPPAAAVSRIELDGDAERIESWLGPHELPIVVRPGRPSLRCVVLIGAGVEIVLDANGPR